MMKAATSGLREQKQEVVRDALYGAAVDLFAQKGFDDTTVEEIAQAAGVSRSTFFRHFESKDDLLAYPMSNYASTLTDAVLSSPVGTTELGAIRQAVLAGVTFTSAAEARTRQVIEISSRSVSARQAYLSRMIQVEDDLAHAYALRFGSPTDELRSRLLAGLTLIVLNMSILAWFRGVQTDVRDAALHAVDDLRSIVSEAPAVAKQP